jgi:hypothetical protein
MSFFERGELLVGIQPTEAFGGLHHAGGGPAQRHVGVGPMLSKNENCASDQKFAGPWA